jgi:hypothetical protein
VVSVVRYRYRYYDVPSVIYHQEHTTRPWPTVTSHYDYFLLQVPRFLHPPPCVGTYSLVHPCGWPHWQPPVELYQPFLPGPLYHPPSPPPVQAIPDQPSTRSLLFHRPQRQPQQRQPQPQPQQPHSHPKRLVSFRQTHHHRCCCLPSFKQATKSKSKWFNLVLSEPLSK